VDFQTLEVLRKNHPAWRLLKRTARPWWPASFSAASAHNLRTIAQQELAAKLEDYLYHLRERLGADDNHAIIKDEQRQSISWTAPSGNERHATIPLVVYSR
jgi:hypothetical protein